MLTPALRLSVALACATILAACPTWPTEACTAELRIQLGPRDTTIPVGASYQARISLSSCGGRKQLSDSFAWTAADPAIVRVDAATGRVTGLAPGVTQVAVEGRRYGRLGQITVAVQPAAGP